MDDVVFLRTTSQEVATSAGIKAKAPSFAISTAFEAFEAETIPSEGHASFQSGEDPKAALQAFIQAEKLPPWIQFSPLTQTKIFGSGVNQQVCAVS